MSQQHRHSKLGKKSSRHSKRSEKSSKYKPHISKKHSNHDDEIKTPPLPSKTSIEELLIHRENLKQELNRITNKPQNSSDKNIKLKSTSSRKRHSSNHEHKKDAKLICPEKSPEIKEPIDSDEEENIIEQRRIERKKLLEKLSHDKIKTQKKDNAQLQTLEMEGHSDTFNKTKDTSHSIDSKGEVKDMFAEKDEFLLNNGSKSGLLDETNSATLNDNWDDAEGYYKVRTGDVLLNRYIVKNTLGQGMFANVVHALDKSKGSSNVAIKIARNNDLMYRNGLKEVAILKQINEADPDNKYHCVRLFNQFIHKGHLCIVLESLNMDLRCVLKKYGRNTGINIKATVNFSRQLLLALKLLKKIGVIHADIKPDNIIVNEKKNIIKLCDFGSAEKIAEIEPKPYLVSRFYRAPEIILGLSYGHAVDLWSTACTIYELATGRIMFTGNSNNKMLKCFMDVKGKIPSKMIKKGRFKDQHFNYNNNFLLHKKDEVTGRDKVVEIANLPIIRNFQEDLNKYCKNLTADEDKKLAQLKDFLDKTIMIDPNQRLSINECFDHPFIVEDFK